MEHNHYRHLSIMAVLSFASMYALMYAMVDSFSNVYANINQLYMAGLMTAPMVIIMSQQAEIDQMKAMLARR